jgi:hypothetical protein
MTTPKNAMKILELASIIGIVATALFITSYADFVIITNNNSTYGEVPSVFPNPYLGASISNIASLGLFLVLSLSAIALFLLGNSNLKYSHIYNKVNIAISFMVSGLIYAAALFVVFGYLDSIVTFLFIAYALYLILGSGAVAVVLLSFISLSFLSKELGVPAFKKAAYAYVGAFILQLVFMLPNFLSSNFQGNGLGYIPIFLLDFPALDNSILIIIILLITIIGFIFTYKGARKYLNENTKPIK